MVYMPFLATHRKIARDEAATQSAHAYIFLVGLMRVWLSADSLMCMVRENPGEPSKKEAINFRGADTRVNGCKIAVLRCIAHIHSIQHARRSYTRHTVSAPCLRHPNMYKSYAFSAFI